MKQTVHPRLLSIDGAANYLGCSRRTVERYIQNKQIKTKRIELPGNKTAFLEKTLIPVEELDALIDRGLTI